MTKTEHELMILPDCLDRFDTIQGEIVDIKENHLVHINEKIESNTKWTKWGIGLIVTFIALGFSLLGIVISLVK